MGRSWDDGGRSLASSPGWVMQTQTSLLEVKVSVFEKQSHELALIFSELGKMSLSGRHDDRIPG